MDNKDIFKVWEKATENYRQAFSNFQSMMDVSQMKNASQQDWMQISASWQPMLQAMQNFFAEMNKAWLESFSDASQKEFHRRTLGVFDNLEAKTLQQLQQMSAFNFAQSQKQLTEYSQSLWQDAKNKQPEEIIHLWQTMVTEYLKDMEAIPDNAKQVDMQHLWDIWSKVAQGQQDPAAETYSKRFWESLRVKLKYGMEYYADPETTEVGHTPRQLVWEEGPIELYHYPAAKPASAPPVLIIYSLINRPYILDLLPKLSLIEYFTQNNLDTYLIVWKEPQYEDRNITLDALISPGIQQVVEFIRRREQTDKVSLLGHCLGGILSLIYAAQYPQHIDRLVTLTTPITSTDGGITGLWANLMPVDEIIATFGNMPAKLIRYSFIALKPYFEVMRLKKFYETLDQAPDKAMQRFYAVDKWVNDNIDVPGKAFQKLIHEVYQKDHLKKGQTEINSRLVDLKKVTCPLINIVATDDWIVTDKSAEIINDLVASQDNRLRKIPGHHLSILLDKRNRGLWEEMRDFYLEEPQEEEKKPAKSSKQAQKTTATTPTPASASQQSKNSPKKSATSKSSKQSVATQATATPAATQETPKFNNVYQMLENTVAKKPHQAAYFEKTDSKWQQTTWSELKRQADLFAMALLAQGLEPEEGVSVLASNRLVWPVSDLGTVAAQGISIGLYPTSSPDQCAYILNHSESRFVVVDTKEQLAKILQVVDQVPTLEKIITTEYSEDVALDKVIHWGDFLQLGQQYEQEGGWEEYQVLAHSSNYDDTAIIVYTSGTTGHPKGACLSHRYVLASSASLNHIFSSIIEDKQELLSDPDENLVFLSFLPFCHVAERISGMYARMYAGYAAYLVDNPARVNDYLKEVSPHIFGGLPRFYEKIYAKIMDEVARGENYTQEEFAWAMEVSRKYKGKLQEGKKIPKTLQQDFAKAEEKVYSKVRANFGQRVIACTSGAAPIPKEVLDTFEHAGNLPILEAYGLTEFVCCAFNTPTERRANSVGKPMPGCQVKISPSDGEILLYGPQMFSGYYKDEEATQEVFTEEGWLRTGDIGKLDSDGFLYITGRKKEFIKTSTGKKIAPLYIENLCKRHPLISNVMVYGDNKKYLTALITLNPEELRSFAKIHNLRHRSYSLLTQARKVKEVINEVLAEVNAKVSSTEQIKKYKILKRDFSIAENEITPTGKVKRKVVSEKYHDLIESMY